MIASLLIVTALTASWAAWRIWYNRAPATALPSVSLVQFDGDNSRERYTKEADSLLQQGYDKYIKNGKPFIMRDFLNPHRARLFLSIGYIDEVKNASQENISLPAVLNRTSTLSKVGGPEITHEIQTSARVDLNRALNRLIEPMQALCFEGAAKDLPSYPEWTSLTLYPKILELFARMSARVMVGPDICDAWHVVSMKYISCVIAAQGAIRARYHPLLYWTAYYLSPEVANVNKARREAAELVRPIMESRRAAEAASGGAAEKHDDFIQWIMDNYRASGKTVDPDTLVQNIFIVMFASLHGTSFVALQSLFSILAIPGAVAEIRDEITRVRNKELGDSYAWTRHALGGLRMLDSYMKETLRLKPFNQATIERVAITPITFKDGLHVPSGTVMAFPTLHYNSDPGVWPPDAGTFDGKRWLRRRTDFDVSKFQFASTAENAFDWGAGPHACPGRFMADVTIKLILVSLITRYDMKLPEDGPERPEETKRFMQLSPDTSTPVTVRDIQG